MPTETSERYNPDFALFEIVSTLIKAASEAKTLPNFQHLRKNISEKDLLAIFCEIWIHGATTTYLAPEWVKQILICQQALGSDSEAMVAEIVKAFPLDTTTLG